MQRYENVLFELHALDLCTVENIFSGKFHLEYLFNCSAGVGRSGVYMVIDSMMERIEDDTTVDVFNFLNHIRTQRIALVQEEVRFVCLSRSKNKK